MGVRKKDGGSKNNSARTSPSKLEDTDFVNSSLLASNSGVFEEEGMCFNFFLKTVIFSCIM